ncbi:hypothetical protein [Tateyamaria sp.]|uniref:hypothetical protein n=1 Tax=Tateyamaria sp. TaxID=1929288 RepID=UPI003B211C6A
MTRFDVARTQQPKSTAAYGSLRFGPLRYQLKRTIGMLPTPDNSECSRQCMLCGGMLRSEGMLSETRDMENLHLSPSLHHSTYCNIFIFCIFVGIISAPAVRLRRGSLG